MTDTPTVVLNDLSGRQGEAWDVLLDLAPEFGKDWTVIGGQMVMLHQAERQPDDIFPQVRFSFDVDVIVNIRAGKAQSEKIDAALRSHGFEQVSLGIEHRYGRDKDGVTFDV